MSIRMTRARDNHVRLALNDWTLGSSQQSGTATSARSQVLIASKTCSSIRAALTGYPALRRCFRQGGSQTRSIKVMGDPILATYQRSNFSSIYLYHQRNRGSSPQFAVRSSQSQIGCRRRLDASPQTRKVVSADIKHAERNRFSCLVHTLPLDLASGFFAHVTRPTDRYTRGHLKGADPSCHPKPASR